MEFDSLSGIVVSAGDDGVPKWHSLFGVKILF